MAGSAGTAGSAGAAGAPAFWAAAYDPAGQPTPADGEHQAGNNCMVCHTSGPGDPLFVLGGTVYQADGTSPAANVEVGVRDNSGFYSGYSATNGNFWVPVPGTIDWASADVRMRNENGESMMISTATGACNQCHAGGLLLKEP
jgi:hypothetical protein